MDRNTGNGMQMSEMELQLLMTETIRRLLSDFRQQLLLEIRTVLHESTHPPQKKWIKSAEVKKLLGISHGTLQTLRNTGRIPFTRVGGVLYYSRDELDKMLQSRHPHSAQSH